MTQLVEKWTSLQNKVRPKAKLNYYLARMLTNGRLEKSSELIIIAETASCRKILIRRYILVIQEDNVNNISVFRPW